MSIIKWSITTLISIFIILIASHRQTRITIFKNIIIMCFILNRKWGHLPWQTIRIEELVDNIARNRNRIFQCA